RGAFLAGMGDQVPAERRAGIEHPDEVRGWVAALRGVQPDARDPGRMRTRLRKRAERVVLGQVPQEAHDEAGGDPELLLAAPRCVFKAVEDRLERDAAAGMRLRI